MNAVSTRRSPPPPSGSEYSSRATPPPFGSEYNRYTPPPSGPQRSSPSPSHNDYDIDNIIIKMFFPSAQDLTTENFTNIFDKQKEIEAGRIIFSKIMSQNDPKNFRKIYLKSMLKLHPDKQTEDIIDNFKKILKEKRY